MAATRTQSTSRRLAHVLVVAALLVPSAAFAGGWNSEPTVRQIERLVLAEPYIRYFTSLEYGPRADSVPAEYIRALILTESGGNADARSGRGARGLTQIIPRTGAAVVEGILDDGYDYLYVDEAALEQFEAEDLHDPALNILIACRLSARYFARWHGSTDHVVAAWNAGPTAVAVNGNQPPPYRETRDLISRVKTYMRYLDDAYAAAN